AKRKMLGARSKKLRPPQSRRRRYAPARASSVLPHAIPSEVAGVPAVVTFTRKAPARMPGQSASPKTTSAAIPIAVPGHTAVALGWAGGAAMHRDVPIGAVVVREGVAIARGRNRREIDQDPTAHAELVAIRRAARRLGSWRLAGCTLYVTLEPCAMCAGAIVLARIDRLVIGAPDPKAGFAGSLGNLVQDGRLNHRVELERGVLEAASGEVLRTFFLDRR